MADSHQSGGVNISNVQGGVTAGGDIVGRDKIAITLQPGQLAEAALRRLAQPFYLRVLVVVSAPLTPQPPSRSTPVGLPSAPSTALHSAQDAPTGEGELLPALNFQQEWADLRRAVLASGAPILLVRLQPPTLDALRYLCSPQAQAQNLAPHVVHFIGHGSPGGIILEDEFGFARLAPFAEIAAALKEGGVRMAVLNACYSALTPLPPSPVLWGRERGEGPGVGGEGITIVGHESPVGDRAAIEFAGALYRELIGGRTAGEAFDRAQIAAPGADSAMFAGDRSLAFRLDPVPAHLPAGPLVEDGLPSHNVPRASHFVGRAAELVQLARTLADAQMKGAVVTGIGGIGKSALAQEAAHRAGWRFPGGMAWLSAREMAGFDLDRAAADLLRALNVPLNPTDDPRAVLVQHLKARPALIVLDNLESIPAPEMRRVRGLLESLAAEWGSKALVTLRPPLPVFDEMPGVRSAPLHTGLDRASAVKYLLALAEQQAPKVEGLMAEAGWAAGRVQGHPKMIEVVAGAARSRGWSRTRKMLEALSGELTDRMDELYGFSVDSLGEEGRRVLPYIPIFPAGSFTLPALRAACIQKAEGGKRKAGGRTQKAEGEEGEWVERGLDAVRDSGLIGFDAGRERYFVHQTVGDYLRQRHPMPNDEWRMAKLRLAKFYAGFAGEHRQDYDALAVEHENLLKAMEWAWAEAQAKGDKSQAEAAARSAVDFAKNLSTYLWVRGYWREELEREKWGIEAAKQINDEKSQAFLLHQAAVTEADQGRYAEARALYQQSLAITEKLGDEKTRAATLHALAVIEAAQGRYAEARALYQQSLAIKEKIGDERGRAATLHQLANIEANQGRYAEARALYQQSLAITEKLGDEQTRAGTLDALGVIETNQGHYVEARAFYEQSLAISERLGDEQYRAFTINHLGILAQREGNRAEAARLFRESLEIFERLGSPEAGEVREWLAQVSTDEEHNG